MFQCPYTYPNSDQGASSLSQCFKYDMSGNKIYYTSSSSNSNYGNCDIEGVSALVTNLQNALDKANKAAAELQEALNKSNQTNNESSVNHSKPDVENMKTAINAGIVDTKMINKPVKKIRK